MRDCWKCAIADAWNGFLKFFWWNHHHPLPPRPPSKCDHCGTPFYPGEFRMSVATTKSMNATTFGADDKLPTETPVERWCLYCSVSDPKILASLQSHRKVKA